MITKFPTWQYILLLIVIILSCIYAIPNIYGEDPSVQISLKQLNIDNNSLKNPVEQNGLEINNKNLLIKEIEHKLISHRIKFKAIKNYDNQLVVHFFDPSAELLAKELLEDWLGEKYNISVNLATLVPSWLSWLGAKPMKLGLDLRGGVRLLIEVDMAIDTVDLETRNMSEFKNSIMERTVATIRNRVNELGVSEAIVQRQGVNHIVVELPGVQDITRAKDILGKTATLNFVMLDDTGVLGPSNRFLTYRDGRKILVKKRVILTGDSIVWASSGIDPQDNKPIVALRLVKDYKLNNFKKFTLENIGKAMAIIYRENKVINKPNQIVNNLQKDENKFNKDALAKQFILEETVISVATIQSELGDSFQITGLNLNESRDLALLLRSGAMPASISIVEERIIGPSLGQENIKMGIISVCLGMGLVLIVMTIYYSLFGLIANITLLFNLILLVASMSIVEATLTLPGIAGIVLTLGMAVDANVLIFERIREELSVGASALLSIHRGFKCALATIVDSNVTTLIVGMILFFIGSGPVKGFAVVLSIGILTSLFTAIIGTKAIISLLYENKYLKRVWVGV